MLCGGSPRPGFVLPVSMRHSCDWFFWRYRCRCCATVRGQPFGSSPLGISLLRRERCAKKAGDSSCEPSEEWCGRRTDEVY